MATTVGVIGAGIVGIAHAWREAARGARVTLFERGERAEGASVRNFGMVWPIGQPTESLSAALLSRDLWLEFIDASGVWSNQRGSIHAAHRNDEWRVLQEFAAEAPNQGYRVRLVNPDEAIALCPGLSPDGLLGGLFSETEIGIDPRQVVRIAPHWLADRHGVQLEFGVTIRDVAGPTVAAADGRRWSFDRVVVAAGADLARLYPELAAANRIERCKLQMLRTEPQPSGWQLGPMVASGLTLRHYRTFEKLPGADALRQRISNETPELDRYGIHVMAAQNGEGEIVLGDSHEYAEDITPFDSETINDLMLRELHKILRLPSWTLSSRWHGVYAIQPNRGLQFVAEPEPGVTVCVATGGCGMTMSFGLAEQMISGCSQAAATAAPST
ncbi:MAG: TIGR03364 family FAD-dependent oxidoreductase [Planctomycetota bacterium]